MMPIGPLMIEHRLIERVIRVLDLERGRIEAGGPADVVLIDTAVDFIRTYADRCHHGKEEDILFRDLGRKPLSEEHARVMRELVDEHVRARGMVKALLDARRRYAEGEAEAAREVMTHLGELTDFYPRHIEKEDRHFFLPVMGYFTEEEKGAMLAEMREFDRGLIHEKYGRVAEELEARER